MLKAEFSVESRWGGSESSPSEERLQAVIAELAISDEEHPDAWLTHDPSGWTIRLDETRNAYLEDDDCNIVGHMRAVSPDFALRLWIEFSKGGRESIANEPWENGPPHVSAEELIAQKLHSDQLMLQSDRTFYVQLGPEREASQCGIDGCVRGTIEFSVLCRPHHFEQIRHRPCPFSD